MGAVLLLGSLTVASLVVSWRRLTARSTLRCFIGSLAGGALGAIPGAVCVVFAMIVSVSGTSPLALWPAFLCAAGGAAGAVAGLIVMDRRASRSRRSGAAWAALAGFIVGVGLSFLALLLAQDSAETAFMILSPLSIAAATVAGYSLRSAAPEKAVR